MDGGFRSWTRPMKIENNSPDLDDYGKPLPPPPLGSYWSRLSDGSWEILEYKSDHNNNKNDIVTVESASVIEHVVMPSDTLQGLSLRYGVSAVALRQANTFSGSAFRSRKVLRIPLEPGATIRVQESTHDVLVQRFKNRTAEADQEARFYLQQHAWDLNAAVADWSGDETWARDHQQQQHIATAGEQQSQQRAGMGRQEQEQEQEDEGEDTPLLTPLLTQPASVPVPLPDSTPPILSVPQSEGVSEGVRVVQPLEIVYANACSATGT